jgi:hypothetical protein
VVTDVLQSLPKQKKARKPAKRASTRAAKRTHNLPCCRKQRRGLQSG